jgi:hypothetical protein
MGLLPTPLRIRLLRRARQQAAATTDFTVLAASAARPDNRQSNQAPELDHTIRLWPFSEAPMGLRYHSTGAGNEEWLLLVSDTLLNEAEAVARALSGPQGIDAVPVGIDGKPMHVIITHSG